MRLWYLSGTLCFHEDGAADILATLKIYVRCPAIGIRLKETIGTVLSARVRDVLRYATYSEETEYVKARTLYCSRLKIATSSR